MAHCKTTTLTTTQMRRLARACELAGYRVERHHEGALRRRVVFWVFVIGQSRPIFHAGRVECCTPSWVAITHSGVWIAGPGYWSGRRYAASLAGVERARADILLEAIAATLAEAAIGAGAKTRIAIGVARKLATSAPVNQTRKALMINRVSP